MYSVYFRNESNEWELLLKGLSANGARNHANMYANLFNTEVKVIKEV